MIEIDFYTLLFNLMGYFCAEIEYKLIDIQGNLDQIAISLNNCHLLKICISNICRRYMIKNITRTSY